MGRDEEASVAFQRALELDPAAAHVYNNLGYLYYRKGDLTHAVEMYQRAIQRGADTSSAYTNLANAYYRLKRVDQAVAAWRRALEIDPANHKAAAALERLGLESRPS
jgi:superkiller protein 3